MNDCCLCKSKKVKVLLDLQDQPVCNRFLKAKAEANKEYKHSLGIAQCQSCGLVQLASQFPLSKILPAHSWMVRYAEPEEHLDALAKKIAKLEGLSKESKICGISFKDDSLVQRLKAMGFSNAWRLGLQNDLGITAIPAGVESVQASFNLENAKKIALAHGKQDVVIARHILEHAYDISGFLNALGQLVKPNGYIVIEVPGCTQAFEQHDYTTVWEEHTAYFTPQTFKNAFSIAGFAIKSFEEVMYPLESSLIVIAQLQKKDSEAKGKTKSKIKASHIIEKKSQPKHALDKELALAEGFAKGFSGKKHEWSEYLSTKGRIALFGAGHLACAFINFFDLKNSVELVIDDDPNKNGLFMPGSGLPIVSSNALLEKNISLCLLSLNPRNEDKVIQKNQAFINNRGVFISIFPSSKYALKSRPRIEE